MNNAEINFKEKVAKLVNNYNVGNLKYTVEGILKLLKKHPNNTFLYNLLGSCFQKNNDPQNAKKAFLKVLEIDANDLAAMNNLGNTLRATKNFNEAEEYFKKILKLDPSYINALVNYGSLNYDLNKYEEAISLFKAALKINNEMPLCHNNLALVYMSLGNFKDSIEHFNEVLRINPKITLADKYISKITKYESSSKHLKQMEEKINIDLSDDAKINLYFALGKAYEDLQKYERSFFYLEQGNNLKKKLSSYNDKVDNFLFSNIKKIFGDFNFTKSNIDSGRKNNSIFIVGMPRSGTSLVEQIISSHSQVYGSGELSYLDRLVTKNFNIREEFIDLTKNIKDNNLGALNDIAKNYVSLINRFQTNKKFITDKAPLNFLWIGFIRIIFPNAKIIHVSRNPKDNCLSLYKNIFDGNFGWTYDQKDLLNFYKNYHSLMNFWTKRIPNFIHTVQYEDLINNPKIETEKLLSFCDLAWEDDCLKYFNNKRAIKTVSAPQARQPIYKTSLNSNQNFEIYLKELFSGLEKF